MFHTFTRSCCSIALGLSLASIPGMSVCAQEPPANPEGTLTKWINPDAKDTATKLDVLQHEAYKTDLQVTILGFMQEYGDRITLKRVHYPSSDRTLVPAYVFTPAKRQAGKRYPALVIVHGGFHERLDPREFPLIEMAVERGYVVIFPEYRGSSGYGKNHYANSYGVTDLADVLSSADYLAKQSYVDPERIGIVGHSRGGMVTLLAIEKAPKKFRVAVDIAGLTDFLAYMAYKPEYRRQEVANEASFKGKMPYDNLAAYMAVSPINNVDAIETPLLVLATTHDETVPLALHTGRLIDALKARGKTYEAKIYENAPGGHVFIFGDSEEQRDCFQRIFGFVGKYLKP
ncbi:MAG: alpha/beta fold hydrolase [Proteobacteria bacterium]|nr:alpha/beta fold hydrolase [Pseudomonadota bacterium]